MNNDDPVTTIHNLSIYLEIDGIGYVLAMDDAITSETLDMLIRYSEDDTGLKMYPLLRPLREDNFAGAATALH